MKDINKIYIIHYTKLKQRKVHMEKQMRTWFPNVKYEFIEDFDQEELSDEVINDNFDLEVFETKFERKMLKSEMSLCMKYKKAVEDIVKSDKGEYFFILEDDVIFKEDAIEYVSKMNSLCLNNNTCS